MASNENETTEEERAFLRRRYFREQPSTRELFMGMGYKLREYTDSRTFTDRYNIKESSEQFSKQSYIRQQGNAPIQSK